MTETALDTAHAAMQAAPEDDAARLRFFERLADAELSLLLEHEAHGDRMTPQVFSLDEGDTVLAFDTEERLASFTGAISAQATLSGRGLVALLAPQGLGVGLNLGVAPSSILIPHEAVAWLADTLADGPQEVDARPVEFSAPHGLPEALVTALDAKLPAAAGLARFAYLSGVTYEDGRRGHMLAIIDAVPGAEHALAKAASEALIFSGLAAGEIDVAFFAASDALATSIARVALRFDLPEAAAATAPAAPGMDPARPPRLK